MAPVPGDSSKHQFGTSMPQGGHPPHHSITSSARASSVGGMSRPSSLAAFRLIAISNLVGCTTGAGVNSDLPISVGKARSVTDQCSGRNDLPLCELGLLSALDYPE